jgi:thiamine biosynthesis lipoprotein
MGIRHPRRDDALLATLPISTGAVATSGDYERFLDFEGRRHSHILDPRTGESVTGLQSVTVMAPTCLVAGSIATIAMLKGNAGGASWLQASGAAYLAVEAAGEVMGNL